MNKMIIRFAVELDEKEINLFHRAVETDEHSGSVEDVSDAIFTGELQLWVWKKEDGLCLAITSVASHRDGYREMIVSMLAGSGVMGLQPEVAESLKKEAEKMGCSEMVAYIKPELAEKFGSEVPGAFLNGKKKYVVFGAEV